MIIAKNDEAKRSKIWMIVTTVSSVLVIVIAIFLLTKMFTGNPLEGRWADEDGNMNLTIERDGSVVVNLPEIGEEDSIDVVMEYTLDMNEKTITIKEDEEALREIAEQSDGQYTEETLKNAVSPIVTTFDYSEEQDQLILTEREFGDQMIFIKE